MNRHVAVAVPEVLAIVLREKCHSLWHFPREAGWQ
jgi:hypothetical protein